VAEKSGERRVSETVRSPRQTGLSGWIAADPLAEPWPELTGTQTADVTIIGGGVCGLMAAQRLIQIDPNLKVIVLDAHEISSSGSGRSFGVTHFLSENLFPRGTDRAILQSKINERTINQKAIAFMVQCARDLDLPAHVFRSGPQIWGAAGRRGQRRLYDIAGRLTASSAPFEWLDQAHLQTLTGSRFYRQGIRCLGAIYMQPAAFVGALSKQLGQRVRIHEYSRVLEILKETGGWRIRTPKAQISTQKIILTNNGHIEQFGYATRRLLHLSRYVSMSEPLTEKHTAAIGGATHWALTSVDPLGFSMRRIKIGSDDRLVVTGGTSFHPSQETSPMRIRNASWVHDRKIKERYPNIPNLRLTHHWSAMRCFSGNGGVVFGELDTGLFAACCHNDMGVTKDTLHGMAIAELAVRGGSPLADAILKQPKPQALPSAPLAALAINSGLLWREWRAGTE
jgi:glycine/D-amino acid oxidase-like deaminating enzyme